ncbi:DUF881 domain-containing protein [Nocardioides psychrotolerans]|uniref:DUF881 domain-containing protein n=1 Tax=Nocardioides psychrotolerans TaxID=1005945 RepID=UPI0031380A24
MPDRVEERLGLPPRVTLPLLDLIQQQALDEDYLVAAERRAGRAQQEALRGSDAGADDRSQRTPRRIAAVVVAVFGIMASTAAVQTQRNASVDDEGRASLVSRIDDQSARVAGLQERIAQLRDSNASREARARAIAADEAALTPRLRRLRVRTGFVAVRGEGISVVVDDAASGSADGVVRDEDLALLADGLWTAGAEAISINGQRLTALSSIRTSGQAIEVNGIGIAPPYSVLVIGNRNTLQAEFFETSSGLAFNDLSARFGFEFDLQDEDSLSLPSGPSMFLFLRSAVEGSGADQNPPKTEEMNR